MSVVRDVRSTLSEYLQALPTYVNHEKLNHCGIYYAEWADGDLLSDSDEVSEEDIVQNLRDKHDVLSSFGFQVGGNNSLYNSNFFVAPTAIMGPFDGLAVIRRAEHPQSSPFDELHFNPSWYEGLFRLSRYYQLNQWAESRLSRLQKFDSDADRARNSLLSISSTGIDIDDVMPVSEEIQSLQIEYTEFRTRYDVAHQSFQETFSERADEGTDSFGSPLDFPLSRPDEPQIVEGDENRSNSIIEYFEDASSQTIEKVNDRYTQVTGKVESLVSAVEGRTRLAATDENLKLQNEVRKLTGRLTLLTVILVLLTVILVALTSVLVWIQLG